MKTLIGKCFVCGKSFEIIPARNQNFYLPVCLKCKEEIRKSFFCENYDGDSVRKEDKE